jgi:hypothetical protein
MSPVALADTVSADTTTTIIFACGKLFSLQANAAGLTPAERARIVQRNLDNALVAARDHSPSSVRVSMMNHNPVVTLDNYYIVTADGNSAARVGLTQLELADKWAEKIRACLADKVSVEKYLSMLTGKFSTASVQHIYQPREDVAVVPSGMLLPVELIAGLNAKTACLGNKIEASVRTDIPLGPDFTTYLPAGTRAIGELVYADKFVPNHYGGKNALTPWFYSLQTPDGKDIPIAAYLVGDINVWKNINTKPITAIAPEKLPTSELQVENLPNEAVVGEVEGAWRGQETLLGDSLGFTGEPGYKTSSSQFNGLIIPKHAVAIPGGTQMMLQLAKSTSIAVSSKGREVL